ncbi:UDP-3-O-(3-hydroxymyristoyl)glucosamine N-acyltransferase [bacterium]|nr:UDP-3-O-(3-hydroxymyristoyl)glucosamine N-acyltransferase [bacterium]
MAFSKTLKELAELTGATLSGPDAESVVILSVGPLEQAGANTLSFLANKKYRNQLETSTAAAVVIPPMIEYDKPCLVSKNPYLDFVKIVYLFAPPIPVPEPGVHAMAVVHPGAKLGKDVAIGPFCVVGENTEIGDRTVLVAQVYVGEQVKIGNDCCLYPQVVLRERCVLGNRVILHPGVVIGADGFGFAPDGETYKKIPQIGNVVIEDDVEIGANTTVDRAALGETRINHGSKIDNLIMIAHNVKIGSNTVIAGQAGISGSTKIGNNAMVGGQVGTAGHIHIGNNTILGAQAGISRDVPDGAFVSGYMARPHKEAMRILGETVRLPGLRKKVEDLEARLKQLEKE